MSMYHTAYYMTLDNLDSFTAIKKPWSHIDLTLPRVRVHQVQIKALYDAKVAELRAANRREDFSDMVAAKAAQQKRKQQAAQDSKVAKKAKGGDTFKF